MPSARCSVCSKEANVYIQPPRMFEVRVQPSWLENPVIRLNSICDDCVVDIVKGIAQIQNRKMKV